MKTKFNILMVLVLAAAMLGGNTGAAQAAIPASGYVAAGSIDVADATPTLTAVDPLAWNMFGDVLPARPFLYSVDAEGITITRFNDNAIVGYWPWPESVWIEKPDGSIMEIFEPAGGWGEPVGMVVSYPTEAELGNRVKEIPDLTPPWTFVYVVMPHSGMEWASSDDSVRDMLEPAADETTESSLLLQIDVSDPSFSTSRDAAAPSDPHIAGAILGHGAGQPVYDRSTGNVYVGNLPSNSLPADLASFVSVIHRIPPTVTAEEREIPGIGQPVIRCGPQHPETGIPEDRPQAYACYDPGALHPINDNEHVGGYGEIKQWDKDNPDLLQEQYVWEFRNWPDPEVGPLGTWLTPHIDLVSGEYDGILYGTPPDTGSFYVEARVHNLDDEWGIWSDWHPIQLQVNPTAEYLPIKAQFAVGVPVAYQLEGTGSCTLSGAPDWVDIQPVTNGCAIMGRAPVSGEYYNFSMPDFRESSYPNIPIVFSGNVVGAYNFVPLDPGVGISGLAWHQVEKYQDPSTETPVMTLEFIGVDPTSGQIYQILQPAGQPQPPNERPAETRIGIDKVNAEGAPLGVANGTFGEVAVEADRDIFVAAADGVFMVNNGTPTFINLGFSPSSLSLDSDLRTAIPGVEPGQVDHGVLWAAGSGQVAVIDTDTGNIAKTFPVPGASCVSADFAAQYAYASYVTTESAGVAIFAPSIDGTKAIPRPLMAPRIWSSEEINWNRIYEGIESSEFLLMATGDPLPTLELFGDEVPDGLNYLDNGNGTAKIGGIPSPSTGGDGYAYTLLATNSQGVYAQALGMTVYGPAEFQTGPSATFTAGSASSFTVAATAPTSPILYTWDEEPVMAPGVKLVDNENGTASLKGTPTTPAIYQFTIGANTGYRTDELDTTQLFTLTVNPEGTAIAPAITSADTVVWEVIGAPFAPDQFTVTSIGSPTPQLSVEGTLPPGVTFIDNGDSTATFGGDCQISWPGMAPECLGVLPDEAEGTWTFTIKATNDGGVNFTSQAFTLYVETATSIMTPPPDAPANLTFEYEPGGTPPETQIFSARTLGDTIPYAAVTTADWLSVTPENGLVGLGVGDLTVSVDPTGLIPGTYTGTILVTSAGTDGPFATALVTLTVFDTEPGMLAVFPGTLNFNYNVNNGTLPPVQSVLVMSGGVPLDYTVSTGDAKWLSVSGSGTAPGILKVSVNPRLGAGMHIANLTIDAGAPNGPQTILVTFVKIAGNPDLVRVTFDAGSAPEGLAVNLTTHNLFTTSSNAAAEAAEAGGVTLAEVEGGGPPDPALVFHINPVDQMVLGEIIMHGAGEYIAVNSTTGIAYQASLETGEVAVINGATNKVVTFIPLILNGAVYQPYQIAIDEAQNFIYVGAKSPEPEAGHPELLYGPMYGCKAIRELPSDEAPAGQQELECWHPGSVFVIDGNTNTVIGSFLAGDDPEGVVFAKATNKVYASNEDDGSITVAKGAKRNSNGTITPASVLGTIIHGTLVSGWWQPTCNANNYCGTRGVADLWPTASACYGKDDEAEEADKMAVDPTGNVYIIDDRYRVAKINATTGKVDKVLAIPGYDCELSVPDDSNVVFRNTANNIAYMALGQGKLYIVSEQNTITLIDPRYMTIKATITVPGALELDAITTDKGLNQVYITDESLSALWILKGACANGVGTRCVP